MSKWLMWPQSSKSQSPTIRQDLCEVSNSESFKRPTARRGFLTRQQDLRTTPEICREGRDRPLILWSDVRKSSTAQMQTAWLQGKREVDFQRVLFASMCEVSCCPNHALHVCLTRLNSSRSAVQTGRSTPCHRCGKQPQAISGLCLPCNNSKGDTESRLREFDPRDPKFDSCKS